MTGIQWTEKVWNPTTGCNQVSPGCDHCLAPETRVLRADMTWVPIGEIRVGDRLVAFTEEPRTGQNRVWEESVVEAVWETEKPTIEVELANGATFTASEDHRWLIAQRGASTWWRTTLRLNFDTSVRAIRCEPTDTASEDYQAGYIAGATTGDGTFRWNPSWRSDKLGDPQSYWRVAKPETDRAVLDRLAEYLLNFGASVNVRPFDAGKSAFTDSPVPMAKVETRRLANMAVIAGLCEERPDREWRAGWLAGMFDTDASYCGGSLRFCQSKPNDALERASRYAKELGFDVRPEHFEGSECPTARLYGGIAENIAFLAAISPVITRRCRDFYGKRIETPASRVVGIRRGPVRRLIDITTSTRTFVAEGALTHNCYALTMAKRLKGMGQAKYQRDGDAKTSGPGFGLTVHPDAVNLPLRWRKPRKVFVNSMSDLFHAAVPFPWLADIFAVMAAAQQHTFQVLTKRHARMRSVLNDPAFSGMVRDRAIGKGMDAASWRWPLPNVWLGASAENEQWFDIRAVALLETPAAVRFISAEPLLSPLRIRASLLVGRALDPPDGIGWLIAGGESGPGARPCELSWLRSLRDQCAEAGVPFFCKQLGAVLGREYGAGAHGADWDAWPEDLRVREFPRTTESVTA